MSQNSTPRRCVYFNGCMWGCSLECGDGRFALSMEERQQRLRDRVREEHQHEASVHKFNRMMDQAIPEIMKDDPDG